MKSHAVVPSPKVIPAGPVYGKDHSGSNWPQHCSPEGGLGSLVSVNHSQMTLWLLLNYETEVVNPS